MGRTGAEMRTAPAAGPERFLNPFTEEATVSPCDRLSNCRRFNYPIVNSSETPMTRRDTEVVPSPLVEQRQEDGQRHHSAGTLEHRFPFCSQIVPRENHV